MKPLNSNSWKVLSTLLKMAAEEFGNHGSNDYSLPNTPENFELLTDLERDNMRNTKEKPYDVKVSPDGKELYTSDASLMGYFAHLAKEMSVVTND